MKLQPGDIVDVVAPSSAPKGQKWKQGFQILYSWGLKARLAKGTISPWLFHSNSNQKRAFFLNQAFCKKDSSAVWMLRGGYGMQKLLPSFIKNYPKMPTKLFIGYSDGTALHLFLNKKKQKTLQAPTISDLPNLSSKELLALKQLVLGINTEITFKNLTSLQKTSKQGKTLRAKIIGGNLSLLSSSVGTTCFPSLGSHFLFIEDVNEEDYKVDRMLYHLFYSGALKGVKALLFGSLHPLKKKSLVKMLNSFSITCKIPIIFGLPCGHKPLNYPLPFNTSSALSILGNKAILKVSFKK